MYLELSLTFLGLLLLFEVWRSYAHLRNSLSPPRKWVKWGKYPSVTVIRPIRGLDVEAEQNLKAALVNHYPNEVETIFVFDEEDEPAVAIARAIIAEHVAAKQPGRAKIIFSGIPPAHRTGKLHAMISGLREAKGEVIVFADSDIRPDAKALASLVKTLLSSPQAGSAFAPVVSVRPTQTVGDAGYALLVNGLYGAAASEAARKNKGHLPFIMGQFMGFKRETIAAIGGLESGDGQLVDDMYIGARVNAAGYLNMVAPHKVPIIQQGESLGEFVRTYRRWITFSRSGLPGRSFKMIAIMHGLIFWVGLLATIFSLAKGYWLAAFFNALAPIGVSLSINRLHHDLGGIKLSWRHQWVSFALLLSAPFIYLTIFFHQEVAWRGRVYHLNGKSRLAAGRALDIHERLMHARR